MANNTEFHSQLNAVCTKFKFLKIVHSGDGNFLKGVFPVSDDKGEVADEFEIEIHPSPRFPFEFPRLFEVGGRIPKIADWHIYEDTGSCCITVPIKEAIYCSRRITLVQFIKSFVRPYFYNQAYRRKYGEYINGEYDHGILGKLQYLQEIFGDNNSPNILHYMKICLNIQKNIHKKSKCFCSSNKRMRFCHPDVYQMLKSVSSNILNDEIIHIERQIKFYKI